MNISYDYEELIQELKEEIKHKMLNITDTIQVLRDSKNIINGYKPIIDWYYAHDITIEFLKVDLFDTQKEKKKKEKILKQYLKNRYLLESITVANCLIEMEKWDRIF